MTVKGSFMFEIEFYALPDGRKPVEEFLDSLPVKMRVKALDSLDLLEEYGNQLRMPYSKALSDGIFELRIRFSGDISRIFLLLLHRKQNHSNKWFYQENTKNAVS